MSYSSLSIGSKGKDVETLQKILNEKIKKQDRGMYQDDIPVNGTFGPHTKDFVENFQLRTFLKNDGKVGKKTWAALNGTEAFNCYDKPIEFVEAPDKFTCWAGASAMLFGQISPNLSRPVGVDFEMQSNGKVGGIGNSHANMKKFSYAHGICMQEGQYLSCTQICWLLTNNGRLMLNVKGVDSGLPNGSEHDSHFVILVGARGDGTASGTTCVLYDPSWRFDPQGKDRAVVVESFQSLKNRFSKLTYQVFCVLNNYSSPIY